MESQDQAIEEHEEHSSTPDEGPATRPTTPRVPEPTPREVHDQLLRQIELNLSGRIPLTCDIMDMWHVTNGPCLARGDRPESIFSFAEQREAWREADRRRRRFQCIQTACKISLLVFLCLGLCTAAFFVSRSFAYPQPCVCPDHPPTFGFALWWGP